MLDYFVCLYSHIIHSFMSLIDCTAAARHQHRILLMSPWDAVVEERGCLLCRHLGPGILKQHRLARLLDLGHAVLFLSSEFHSASRGKRVILGCVVQHFERIGSIKCVDRDKDRILGKAILDSGSGIRLAGLQFLHFNVAEHSPGYQTKNVVFLSLTLFSMVLDAHRLLRCAP